MGKGEAATNRPGDCIASLQEACRNRSLVSIRRDEVDEHKIQGFVLAASSSLVLLQYVYDFHLDGFMILRAGDITAVERTKTDEFQQCLLGEEGLLSKVGFGYSVDLDGWRSAIQGLSATYPLLILEAELLDEPHFAIGRILDAGAEEVSLRYFTGAAHWLGEPVRLRYSDITSCQANTNYVNVYQRHFGRSARLGEAGVAEARGRVPPSAGGVRDMSASEVRAVHEFLCAHGWAHRVGKPEWFGRLLERSQCAAVALDQGRIVGFARGITDGLSNGYLSMVVVAPDHRHRGLGSALVRHVMGDRPEITWVLRADRDGAPAFFGKLGFVASGTAMERPRSSRPALR